MHIHVRNSDGEARFEILPVKQSIRNETERFGLAEAFVEERKDEIIKKWAEVFGL